MTNSIDIPLGVGVIVIKDGKILAGTRTDNGLICGPGGHIQIGEQPSESALRELQEEFNIRANKIYQLGAIQDPGGKWKPSMVFLCTDYTGDLKADEDEMTDARFVSIDELSKMSNLFPCFAASLKLLLDKIEMHSDGGTGSGNWGHSSVKGVRGGSAPGGGQQNRLGTKEGGYTSEAKAWAENKKKNKQAATSGGSSSSTSGLKKALESGNPEQLVQAIKDAKPGQIVQFSNSIHVYDYMKLEDGKWINLSTGYEYDGNTLEKYAKKYTQKFSASDVADQDFESCQKKFEDAMKVDHSANKPGQDTYDKVLNTAHELPTGAKYESPDGEVFVKLADGSWVYDDYNVSEEAIAEHLTDVVHGGAAGFKKHAYGEQAPETSNPSASNSGSKKASSDTFDDEKYSQERKDSATWDEPKQEIHDKLVENSAEEWKAASDEEKEGIVEYTGNDYKKINDALYSKNTAELIENDWKPEALKKEIEGATDYLDKCSTKTDVWAQRGTKQEHAPAILGISKDEFNRRLADNDWDDLIGSTTVQEGFISSSPCKGASYNGNLVLNMYIPSGSHASYAEPFSAYGEGPGMSWDGSKETTNTKGIFGEFEMVVQRGSTFKITKIEVEGWKMYIDVDVSTSNKSDLKTLD